MFEVSSIKLVEPSVYLVGRQELNDFAFMDFLHDHDANHEWMNGEVRNHDSGDAEVLIEGGGRLCYMSFNTPRPGGNKAYIDHILQVGHGSVLEHAVWNFIFTGVSRSLSHELVRHRAGMSYSQLSQRYVDESVAEYVMPAAIVTGGANIRRLWLESINQSHGTYCSIVGKLYLKMCQEAFDKTGISKLPQPITVDEWIASLSVEARTTLRKEARQAARSVLPNATETKLMVTGNARAIRNFLELRAHKAADLEIRRLAMMVYEIMVTEAPNIFGDYTVVDLDDGSQCLHTEYRKV